MVKNGHMPNYNEDILDKTLEELRNIAKEKEIKGYSKMTKEELAKAIEEQE